MRFAPRVPPSPAARAAGSPRRGSVCLAPWLLLAGLCLAPAASAQCPEAPPLRYYTDPATGICPCFVPTEQAGAVFRAPQGDYPLEILRVGIGWGSQLGGQPQSLEEAVHIYADSLPNPGTPIFSLQGPLLTDGFINEFNLEPSPGEITIASGPFTATLEFANQNVGDFFAPSMLYDGNGCTPGRNVIFAVPGGWKSACAEGVPGDWVMYVVYRPCVPGVAVGDERFMMSKPVLLMAPRPNPFRASTEFGFALAEPGPATLTVYDVSGRRIAVPADGTFSAGFHTATWDGRTLGGARARPGVYFAELRAGDERARRTVLLTE